MMPSWRYDSIPSAAPLSAADEYGEVELKPLRSPSSSVRGVLLPEFGSAGIEEIREIMRSVATAAPEAGSSSSSTDTMIEVDIDVLRSHVLASAEQPNSAWPALAASLVRHGFAVGAGLYLRKNLFSASHMHHDIFPQRCSDRCRTSLASAASVRGTRQSALDLVEALAPLASLPPLGAARPQPVKEGVGAVHQMDAEALGVAIERADMESRWGKKNAEALQKKLQELEAKSAKLEHAAAEGYDNPYDREAHGSKVAKLERQRLFLVEKLSARLEETHCMAH